MDLKPEWGCTRVGGICVVGGLRAIKPDLKPVAAGADTERVPFAFLYVGHKAVAATGLPIFITLGPGVNISRTCRP